MATIVLHQRTGDRLLLIGTGYGAFKSSRPSAFGGTMFPTEEEGRIRAAAVCDSNGQIKWILTEELIVVEIDGVDVHSIPGITFSD